MESLAETLVTRSAARGVEVMMFDILLATLRRYLQQQDFVLSKHDPSWFLR
jgi:hypothetical protein